jgi:hypothetical protein
VHMDFLGRWASTLKFLEGNTEHHQKKMSYGVISAPHRKCCTFSIFGNTMHNMNSRNGRSEFYYGTSADSDLGTTVTLPREPSRTMSSL